MSTIYVILILLVALNFRVCLQVNDIDEFLQTLASLKLSITFPTLTIKQMATKVRITTIA